MSLIKKETLKNAIKAVWIRSLTEIQPDILEGLEQAMAAERNERARQYLDIIIQNAQIATQNGTVICQDTGVPTFYIRTSLGFPYQDSIQDAFDEAMRELTLKEFPMRSMVVNPLTREERGDNTGKNVPILHFELEPGLDYLEIMAAPKGAGSENKSALKMLVPADGIEGVKKFVVDTVKAAGSSPCPPMVVGVGIGGTLELAGLCAKRAAMRDVDTRNPDPRYAAFEEELLGLLNDLGTGPQGLGGTTTAFKVNVEFCATHIASLPVAVNINCHAARHAEAEL